MEYVNNICVVLALRMCEDSYTLVKMWICVLSLKQRHQQLLVSQKVGSKPLDLIVPYISSILCSSISRRNISCWAMRDIE